MNCDCNDCTRLARVWCWLEQPPGPLSSLLVGAWIVGLTAVLCWWGG